MILACDIELSGFQLTLPGQHDGALRRRFGQVVLASMRGAGEAVFENDLPPGVHVVGEKTLQL